MKSSCLALGLLLTPMTFSLAAESSSNNMSTAKTFSLLLRAPSENQPPVAVDLALALDLSASATPSSRRRTVEFARNLIKNLPPASRVSIVTVKGSRTSAITTPAAIESPELATTLDALNDVVPSGAADSRPFVDFMTTWLAASSELPKAILLLGAMNFPWSPPSRATLEELRSRSIERHASWHLLAEPNESPGPMVALPSRTGGMIFLDTGDVNALARRVGNALARPALFPSSSSIEKVTRSFPNPLPPLRDDMDTLVVGESSAPIERATVRLEGTRAGQLITDRRSVRLVDASDASMWLTPLIERWSKAPSVPCVVDGARALEMYRFAIQAENGRLLVQARGALAERDLARAEALYRQALARQFDDVEAKTGLAAIRGLKANGERRPKRQDQRETPRNTAADDSRSNRSATAKSASNTPSQEPASDLIEEAKAREQVETQRLQRAVSDALREADRIARTDPEAAIIQLKRTLALLESASLDPSASTSLKRRIETQLKTTWRKRQRVELEQLEQQKNRAEVDARRRREFMETSSQQSTRQLIERGRALLADGKPADAEALAWQGIESRPNEPAGHALARKATLADRITRTETVELQRQEGWWRTLASVETSSIPFADDKTTAYPDAKEWEELTIRRQKYQAIDLAPVSPAEEEIRSALSKSITLDFDDTPLQDVVEFVRDFSGVNVVLDARALTDAGIEPDAPISLHLRNVSLKSALNLLLGPLELTYLIKNEVLMVTSQRAAADDMITKIYPVADLITPIPDLNSGGVGLTGALGGGNAGQGGLGGAGFGGFNGPGGNRSGNATGGGNQTGLGGGAGPLQRLIEQTIAPDQSNAKPVDRPVPPTRTQWENALADQRPSERELRRAMNELLRRDAFGALSDLASAYARLAPPTAWSDELQALSSRLVGASEQDVIDHLISPIARAPKSLAVRVGVIDHLARQGYRAEALHLAKATALEFPPSVAPLDRAFLLALSAKDFETVAWTGAALLEMENVDDARSLHEWIRAEAAKAAETIAQEEGPERAMAWSERLRRAGERDLVITADWKGEADVDLSVIEPGGLLCSNAFPASVGGGTLDGDRTLPSERYVATRALAGKYEIYLRVVTGRTTDDMVIVNIIEHQGTDREKRHRHRVSLSEPKLSMVLAEGRREGPAAIVGRQKWRRAFAARDVSASSSAAQIRELVQTGVIGRGEIAAHGGPLVNEPSATRAPIPPLAQLGGAAIGGAAVSGGAVAFNPIVTTVNDGASLSVQAVVSADRRYVRLTAVPVIQAITGSTPVQLTGVAVGR